MDLRNTQNNALTSNNRVANRTSPRIHVSPLGLRPNVVGAGRCEVIPRRQEAENDVPFLPGQRGIWMMQHLHRDAAFYNLSSSWPLHGCINIHALQQGLCETVRRHEVLRTTFVMVNGDLVQAVAQPESTGAAIVDLTSLSLPERWNEVERLSLQERSRAFHLETEFAQRKALLLLSPDDAVLLHSVHHIAFDGKSSSLFLNEWNCSYTAFASGVPSSLPELPVQCGDIALWYQRWMSGKEAEAQLAYWLQKLEEIPPDLELPVDRPRKGQRFLRAREERVLSAHAATGLRTLTSNEGGTVFMGLLAVLQVLLYRYTGQRDFFVGTLFSGRTRSEFNAVIGPFFNTLMIRGEVKPDMTFRDVVRKVRQTTLAAYSHADYPFEDLIERVREMGRLVSRAPFRIQFGMGDATSPRRQGVSKRDPHSKSAVPDLFSVLTAGLNHAPTLKFEAQKRDPAEIYGGNHSWLASDPEDNRDFELALWGHQSGDELRLRALYNLNLFDPATVVRFLRDFGTLADAVVNCPDQPIATIDLLTPPYRHQLLREWNDTRCFEESEESFSQMFEAQVDRTPDSVAIACSEQQMSYSELNSRADRLALSLRHLGVSDDSVVGLCAARGIDFLTAVLATLKIGAAYCPLEASDPETRLHQMVECSQLKVILASAEAISAIEKKVKKFLTAGLTTIHKISALVSPLSCLRHLSTRSDPRNLAYVLYTSGSSGTPKGVMVEQRGMVNHLRAKRDSLQLNNTDIVGQNASQRFDISVWQFLTALIVGARVCIINDEIANAPLKLLGAAERETVTVLELVPSLLSGAIDELTDAGATRPTLSALRHLLVTGEEITPKNAQRWLSLYPRLPLVNAYGPTECSDDVTHYMISRVPGDGITHLPIGRALRNTSLYILDDALSPVPIAITGELHVGGMGVGRGYVSDPMRTAEAFVPDPFLWSLGARMYKTGDLARSRPDGSIEYRGRLDHQVKVRGYRIELAELEATLYQHPAVQQAVVLAREDELSDKCLLAYAVVDSPAAITSAELHFFLAERLPHYMLPTNIVLLDSFPVNTNGKIDRHALSKIRLLQLDDSVESILPQTEVEKKIAQMWSEIFNRNSIGIYDNFFEVGGHSIKAVRLVNRINHAFGINLSVRHVFEEPTIAGQALLVEESVIDDVQTTHN